MTCGTHSSLSVVVTYPDKPGPHFLGCFHQPYLFCWFILQISAVSVSCAHYQSLASPAIFPQYLTNRFSPVPLLVHSCVREILVDTTIQILGINATVLTNNVLNILAFILRKICVFEDYNFKPWKVSRCPKEDDAYQSINRWSIHPEEQLQQ